jgi:hypothetical protein
MIVYRLSCGDGHEFEGWFKDSGAYDSQAQDGTLVCPTCGAREIGKAIMAPSVKNSVTRAESGSLPATPPSSPAAPPHPDAAKLRRFMAGYRKFVEENADYVGRDFPEEARKIHYGETEDRHIYGESTPAEARALIEEGIDVAALPPDPEDLN